LKIPRPKKFVLVRMERDGQLFVLDRSRWEQAQRTQFYRDNYQAEVVAEADTTLPLMQFKDLTQED